MTALIRRRLVEKGLKRKRQRYSMQVVTAIAVSKKGNILGTSCNNPSNVPGMRHKHAEGILMARFGKSIYKIFILRVGRGGNLLPIEPCEQCLKLALRLGISIESIGEENDCK